MIKRFLIPLAACFGALVIHAQTPLTLSWEYQEAQSTNNLVLVLTSTNLTTWTQTAVLPSSVTNWNFTAIPQQQFIVLQITNVLRGTVSPFSAAAQVDKANWTPPANPVVKKP